MFTCSCGRTFPSRPGLTNHENRCQSRKKRQAEVLGDAHTIFTDMKRQRREAMEDLASSLDGGSTSNAGVAGLGSEPAMDMPVSPILVTSIWLLSYSSRSDAGERSGP